jgi:hypothetical protein
VKAGGNGRVGGCRGKYQLLPAITPQQAIEYTDCDPMATRFRRSCHEGEPTRPADGTEMAMKSPTQIMDTAVMAVPRQGRVGWTVNQKKQAGDKIRKVKRLNN